VVGPVAGPGADPGGTRATIASARPPRRTPTPNTLASRRVD